MGGNSDILCDEFMKGALEQGNVVEKIRVADKKIAPCSGCYFCRKSGGRCALNDDMVDILQKLSTVTCWFCLAPFTSTLCPRS